MSADAKIWRDKDGWHGICDGSEVALDFGLYGLSEVILDIENEMKQKLDWDICHFANGLALRGYRARPSGSWHEPRSN